MALNMALTLEAMAWTLISGGISTCKGQSAKKKITYGQGQQLLFFTFCKETNKQEEDKKN